MSAARKAQTVAKKAATPATNAFSFMPTFSSVPSTRDGNCTCSNCCRPTTTVCLTFDMSFIQNLINMLPKVNISSGNTCDQNNNCEDEPGQ